MHDQAEPFTSSASGLLPMSVVQQFKKLSSHFWADLPFFVHFRVKRQTSKEGFGFFSAVTTTDNYLTLVADTDKITDNTNQHLNMIYLIFH